MLKKSIGILLRKLPRTLLQRISRPIFKIISIFYKGNSVECPLCKKSFRNFFPYGRKTRNNALCMKTIDNIGYVITDIDREYDKDVFMKLKSISQTIRLRVLY